MGEKKSEGSGKKRVYTVRMELRGRCEFEEDTNRIKVKSGKVWKDKKRIEVTGGEAEGGENGEVNDRGGAAESN